MSTNDKPFPALTPAQRLHLEINGYVIIENLLTKDEIGRLVDTLYDIEAAYRKTGELRGEHCHYSATEEHFFRIDNLPHLAPAFFDYLTHPFILAMAEEIVGGSIRLEQSDAHIHRAKAEARYGFHRGINPGYAHTANGLYHFSFVKALTNLTDLGPDDGGTTVIAGTHKVPMEVDNQAIIQAAMDDPNLIHQVIAPAGSTLLFYESLMHSSGIIRSDKDRLLILGGYTPMMFQTWNGYDPHPEFAASLSDAHRTLLTGDAKYGWQRRTRSLGEPAAFNDKGIAL
jgi:ectoine hydroxylase-related dioxygenase (phytanoyl-CoA dioxygenase family)